MARSNASSPSQKKGARNSFMPHLVVSLSDASAFAAKGKHLSALAFVAPPENKDQTRIQI
jgi:hypothetical protein